MDRRINVIPARDMGMDVNKRISEIFVEGFYQWLRYFSKDKQKLAGAFEHMFITDFFYLSVIDGEITGITACTDGKTSCVYLKRREFIKHLGFVRGNIACSVLKKEFMMRKYPFNIQPGTASIEFVATAPEFRGKGIAASIIRYIIDVTSHAEYVLEVADTNENAVRLYQKLGFAEFQRVKQKYSEQSGINYLVYMKYSKQ